MPERSTILVVDDSQVMRTALRHELAGEDLEVVEARHGREALALIERGLRPDLVTLDIEMPEMGGFETCAQLYSDRFRACFTRCRDGRVPVVFLTASDNLADRKRGFELGAVDFVSKSYDEGSLARLVRGILRPRDRLRGLTVLVVDDSPTIRRIVGRTLSDEGVNVLEAEDGLQGFTVLCNRMDSVDLVITDIEMPVLDGPGLCQRIRRELGLRDLPVVFFTGADQAHRLAAFHAGATDCLSKPFLKEEMLARLVVHVEKAMLDRRLRQSVRELKRSLEIQREMLATLSHDMRSPLTGVIGFSDLLLLERERPPAETENLELIKHSGQMLLSLVDDILSLSKQQSGRSELEMIPVELHTLLARCVAMVQALAVRKEQRVTFENRAGEAMINGHAESLVRVFNNLLSNAIKFTPAGGAVRVGLEAPADHQVLVTVTDTGIGIPADRLPALFERYSGLSKKGTAGEAGTGLGMSIVKEFVEAHRGQISVASKPGEGTRFRLRFPVLEAPPPDPVRRGPPADEAQPGETRGAQLRRYLRGRHILFVDDNPVNHLVGRAILAGAGCTVVMANNGRDALEAVRGAGRPFDAILMDMEMPVMDGLAATRALRATGNTAVPVIALTGNASDADREACHAAGMNGFLTKPLTPSLLLETLASVC